MNKYVVDVTMTIEASNQEAAEDIARDILESDPEIIDYTVIAINDN